MQLVSNTKSAGQVYISPSMFASFKAFVSVSNVEALRQKHKYGVVRH